MIKVLKLGLQPMQPLHHGVPGDLDASRQSDLRAILFDYDQCCMGGDVPKVNARQLARRGLAMRPPISIAPSSPSYDDNAMASRPGRIQRSLAATKTTLGVGTTGPGAWQEIAASAVLRQSGHASGAANR